MAVLCWMVVVLAFSTSIGNSEAVDRSTLTAIVKQILRRYFMNNMQFSLAVKIPVDQNKIQEALNKDQPETVKEMVSKGGVYYGTNVVAATFQENTAPSQKPYTDHAEARVLDKIGTLAHDTKNHILVLYSYLSPCDTKCTDPTHNFNILGKINQAFEKYKWADHAFVFTKVFDKGGSISKDKIREAFRNLGKTGIGRDKIFRCYPPTSNKACIQCFEGEKLSDRCVKN